jgi:hypothetical protein
MINLQQHRLRVAMLQQPLPQIHSLHHPLHSV